MVPKLFGHFHGSICMEMIKLFINLVDQFGITTYSTQKGPKRDYLGVERQYVNVVRLCCSS